MNILEELWHGNIEPTEYDISPSKEYKELLQLISRNWKFILYHSPLTWPHSFSTQVYLYPANDSLS